MLTNAEVAELFDIEETNISAYSEKKTANLRWEKDEDRRWELNQEILIIVHLKQVQWDSNKWGVGTSKLQLSYYESIPYVIQQKDDGCILYE